MRTSESITHISCALLKVQSESKAVTKNGKNNAQNYTYAKLEDYITSIKSILDNNKVFIMYSIKETKRLEPRAFKTSTQYPVEVLMTTRMIHESGEWIEVDTCGEGIDAGDKSVYKAITGARKYGLACLLNLSTTDDPEEDDLEEGKKITNRNIRHYDENQFNNNASRERILVNDIIVKMKKATNEEELKTVFIEAHKIIKQENIPPHYMEKITLEKNNRKLELAG